MLAATPPMGWNSWNMFGAAVDARIVQEAAEAFVKTGLKDAGYQYVVVDDHWHGGRGADGRLFPDPQKFPDGMKAVADHVHSLGLKFGIYSDAGPLTCGGRPASQDNEEIDARTFAEWGVDFLKYDWCHAEDTRANAEYRYSRMSAALRATGREIVLSICEWGHHRPWLWGAKAGGQLWRTTGDIGDSWYNVIAGWGGVLYGIDSIGFDQQRGLEAFAGPGGWNDTDMLVVGLRGRSKEIAGAGCTDSEYRTHFSLWCMLAAPLMIGCDVRSMDAATREILTNAEAIAVDQDPLGRQGSRASRNGMGEVWVKPMAGGQLAVGLFNRGDKRLALPAAWSDLEIGGRYRVRDLWAHTDLGVFDWAVRAELEPHGCALFRLTPEG
ncbi:MAG TPA: glycoside hydrolase family 27 protein [Anaerolineales bacterium]|nr:glycoside hydrolase family 27 protein [Anaerolineales bacterium]